MADENEGTPLRDREFYLVETGVGLGVTLALFFGLTGVVGGTARIVVAVVAGLVVSNGLQWYRN